MTEHIHSTPAGEIHYWVGRAGASKPWLVFLPGLTADHHLFDRQLEYFQGSCNCLAWDAPAHGLSRPFRLDFTMDGMARYLHEILQREGAALPVLVGQSLGGYVAQAYLARHPAAGFVPVDSCPLARDYYTGVELAMLKHTYWMYRCIPWRLLVKLGAEGTARSAYGRELMRRTMEGFTPKEYCRLAAHGYKLLAQAVESGKEGAIPCPVLLLCGEKDGAGSAKRYNRAWARREGYRLVWLKAAGHNSNTDAPEEVNRLIEEFVSGLTWEGGRE